ncbi:MAG: hypothetical protein IT168_24325 [Bryobacterales bacterium]|nr:hypothetical protein [Bryobacterales bacterium]
MGIGFVLLFWLVAGVLLAIGASVVIWNVIRGVVPSTVAGHNRLLFFGTALPFACLAWSAVVFVGYAVINVAVFHRDIGIGDGFNCPLPNGYALEFVDVLDSATLFRRGDTSGLSIPNVTHLQLTAGYMLGSSDTGRGKLWFILNERTGQLTDFRRLNEFETAARARELIPRLAPVAEAYQAFRYTWFDALAAFLLIVPPVAAGVLLMRSISTIRS